MILICYDGSDDSRCAVEHAGELLGAQPATVLTVWTPFVEVLAHSGAVLGLTAVNVDFEEVDEASRISAEKLAQEGAERAREAGFSAQPRTCSQQTTVGAAILSEADAVGAGAIVMGSRGLTGLKSLLLGSVSHAVIQHADRTVIVVPSAKVASERERERERRAGHSEP